MFPNPQEALPLPTRPNVERYKKLAKDLARACKSGDPSAVRSWAMQWIDRLATLQDAPRSLLRHEQEINAQATVSSNSPRARSRAEPGRRAP